MFYVSCCPSISGQNKCFILYNTFEKTKTRTLATKRRCHVDTMYQVSFLHEGIRILSHVNKNLCFFLLLDSYRSGNYVNMYSVHGVQQIKFK